jgi:hypothetical protein
MSGNIQEPREWRGDRRQIWLGVVCGAVFVGALIFTNLLVFHPEWDKHANGETPASGWFFILVESYGVYGFMLLLACWYGWTCRHARLRVDASGVELQHGLQLKRVRWEDVKKVSWGLRSQKVTLTGSAGRTNVNFGVYTLKDKHEIIVALHEALGGQEQENWEKIARRFIRRERRPVSLPQSERMLLRYCGGLLVVSVIAAVGLPGTPNHSEWRRGFWLLEVLCAMGGTTLVLLVIWEMIRYQRTWRVVASLVLALAASGVAGVAMVHAVSAKLIQLRIHGREA